METQTPVYIVVGEQDESYGVHPSQQIYDQLYARYLRTGFAEHDIQNQHGGAANLFAYDAHNMG